MIDIRSTPDQIPRIKLLSREDEYLSILDRTQFPVRLCFAMTIHKSHGQSFNAYYWRSIYEPASSLVAILCCDVLRM